MLQEKATKSSKRDKTGYIETIRELNVKLIIDEWLE